MFEKARIKLTIWYLLIIMAISFAFSGIIYKSVADELEARLDMIEHRINPQGVGLNKPTDFRPFFIEDLEIAKNRLLLILIYTNTGILMVSAIAGYFLADRTLKPIEEAMDEQKRFVADASHELKTPLTSLQTSMEVALRDKKMSLKESRKILNESLEDIGQLTALTNYLLGLAKYQDDKNGLVFERVNLKSIINTVNKKVSPLAKKKNITIKIDSQNQMVTANSESLEKLLTILIDNAVKYTPRKGKIVIKTKKGTRCVNVIVKDNGIGISKKDLPFIFERFYRADQSRSKMDIQGFGLGLSMAQRIVDLHNGSIKVESREDQGATFIVKLPA